MAQNLDLLGDPVPENWGRPGRPAHIPTTENGNKVMVLLAFGWDDQRIARALGISLPTLRKHYKFLRRYRDEARDRLESAVLISLANKAVTGDVPAMRELRRLMEKADQAEQHRKLVGERPADPAPEPPARQERLGKKEVRKLEAEAALDGMFAPGPAPARLN